MTGHRLPEWFALRSLAAALAIAAAGLAPGCGGSSDAPIVLTVEAAPASIRPGASAVLTVRAAEANGDPVPDGTQVTFLVEPPLGVVTPAAVGTTAGSCAATFAAGAAPGVATITASAGAVSAQAAVTVEGGTIARIVLVDFKIKEGSDGGFFRICGYGFCASRRLGSNATADFELPRGGRYALEFYGACAVGDPDFGYCGSRDFPANEERVVEVRGPCGGGDAGNLCVDKFGP